jgi:FAD/FMN-containing dehydrogenase
VIGLDKPDSQAYPGPLVVPRGGGFSTTRGAVHLREALANLEQAESIVVCV